MKLPKEWKSLQIEDYAICGMYGGRYSDKASKRRSAREYARTRLRWKYKRYITKKMIARGLHL